jgi:hypothetical protein
LDPDKLLNDTDVAALEFAGADDTDEEEGEE